MLDLMSSRLDSCGLTYKERKGRKGKGCTYRPRRLPRQTPHPGQLDQIRLPIVRDSIYNNSRDLDGPVVVQYRVCEARFDGRVEGAAYVPAEDGLYCVLCYCGSHQYELGR